MNGALAFRPLVAKQARVVAGRRQQARRAPVRAVAEADSELYAQFDALLNDFDFNIKAGDKVSGRVFRVDAKGAHVDVGGKGAAFCPTAELSMMNVTEASEIVQPNTTREFVVVRDDLADGTLILSLKRLEQEVVWQRLRQIQEEEVIVAAKVISSNRGGLLVDVMGVRGFLPTSQLSPQYSKAEIMGQEVPVVIMDVDESRTRLVVSNRKALQEEMMNTGDVSPGDVVLGTVQNVKPYGAFIDMGGVFGLLHISQMSSELIPNINNVVAPGDKIKVMILGFDKDKNRFAVTTRKLEPAPGDFIRNPQQVFDRAEEMAKQFKQRISAAEGTAEAAE
ncbi:unnamed protein product [Pedinophyceae sp. YPF-701]|nr:unnamed protein product [Pedinophyceae sp. YPF-701]